VKRFQRNAISIGLLSILVFSMVFFLTGCGFFNQGPTAEFTFSPSDPTAGDQVTFDASSSSDPDGQIASYDWDFNNDGNFTDTGKTQTHSYSSSDTFTVVLKVTDDVGATDETQTDIDVQ